MHDRGPQPSLGASLDIGDIQEALRNRDSLVEGVSNALQQRQDEEDISTGDIINLKNETNTKLDAPSAMPRCRSPSRG